MLFTNAPIEVIPDFWWLPSFVETKPLLVDIDIIAEQAPFRHMQVPTGGFMKVAMTNCGAVGWTSSTLGYSYSSIDRHFDSNIPWPAIPTRFKDLAAKASKAVGFGTFEPDACLINRYQNGAGMGLHRDKDERDLAQPIVSVSIGDDCKFIIGGLTRHHPSKSMTLSDGDVLVWGKSARLVFHGVRPLRLGQTRYNLTLRKAQ
jgi:DNA oxidative demethylase